MSAGDKHDVDDNLF